MTRTITIPQKSKYNTRYGLVFDANRGKRYQKVRHLEMRTERSRRSESDDPVGKRDKFKVSFLEGVNRADDVTVSDRPFFWEEIASHTCVAGEEVTVYGSHIFEPCSMCGSNLYCDCEEQPQIDEIAEMMGCNEGPCCEPFALRPGFWLTAITGKEYDAYAAFGMHVTSRP